MPNNVNNKQENDEQPKPHASASQNQDEKVKSNSKLQKMFDAPETKGAKTAPHKHHHGKFIKKVKSDRAKKAHQAKTEDPSHER